MSQSTLTVSQLLPLGMTVDPSQLCWDAGTSKAAAGLDGFVKDKVRDGVVAALDMDVLELIATAWAKVDDLADVADASRRTPGQTTHVFLAKHDVICENKLNVALEFAGVPAVTDHLRIKLTAKFEGIGMTIDGGYIVALDAAVAPPKRSCSTATPS